MINSHIKLAEIVLVNPSSWSKKNEWKVMRYLDTANITESRINEIAIYKLGEDNIPSRARRIVQSGDFIYSTVRPNQKHYGLLNDIPDNLVVSTGFTVIRSKYPEKFDTRYIYLLVTQNYITDYLHGVAENNTSAYPSLRPSDLTDLKFAFPTISEQKAVSDFIGTLDHKIELNKKLNQTLEDIAKAIFKSWFVDFDPVRAKAEGRPTGLPADISDLFPDELVDSDIGEIPRGWQIGTISRYAALNKKTINPSLSEEIFEHFSIPAFDDKQWPMLDKGTDIKSSKTLVPKGALLVSKLNPNTPRVWLPKKKNTYKQICSTEFMVLTPSPMGDIMFLWGMFTSNCIADRMTAMVTGTSKSHQRVKPTDVLNIKIPAPGEKLVKAFSDAVKPMLEKTLIGKSESEILVELRDTLLPKLISGELRIPDAERFIATIDNAPSA